MTKIQILRKALREIELDTRCWDYNTALQQCTRIGKIANKAVKDSYRKGAKE